MLMCSEKKSDVESLVFAEQLLEKLANRFDCIREKYWSRRLSDLRARFPLEV